MKKNIKKIIDTTRESAYEIEKEFDAKDQDIDYPTEQTQRTHILIRISRIISGFVIIFIGLLGFILPVIPGGAMLIIGLGILSLDFKWAYQVRQKVQQKLAGNPEGKMSKKRTIIFLLISVCAILISSIFSYFKYIK